MYRFSTFTVHVPLINKPLLSIDKKLYSQQQQQDNYSKNKLKAGSDARERDQ